MESEITPESWIAYGTGQSPTPWKDTPVLAAKRRAFDSPTIENLDKLIDAVRQERSTPSASPNSSPTAVELAREAAEAVWRLHHKPGCTSKEQFADIIRPFIERGVDGEKKRAEEAERKLEECDAMVTAEQHANARLRESVEVAKAVSADAMNAMEGAAKARQDELALLRGTAKLFCDAHTSMAPTYQAMALLNDLKRLVQ